MRHFAWVLAVIAFGASAQVYKWVDEKGQVHYGEQPPPEAKTTTINVPPPGPTAPPPSADKPKAATDPAAKVGYDTPKEKDERCTYEKKQLDILTNNKPVEFINDKKEKQVIPADKRADLKKQVEENIKKYCS
jgi:Domain of unknown function (DUF4124)